MYHKYINRDPRDPRDPFRDIEKIKNLNINLQNDFEKGQGSLGPYMEFVNIFNAFSEITYTNSAKYLGVQN